MYCKYCDNKLTDGATYCTKCGKRVKESSIYEENIDSPRIRELKNEISSTVLTFAIISLCLDVLSLGAFTILSDLLIDGINGNLIYFIVAITLPILGLVFSIVAKKNARGYASRFGETEGKATVGKHLSVPSLIASIVLIALLFLLLVIKITYII